MGVEVAVCGEKYYGYYAGGIVGTEPTFGGQMPMAASADPWYCFPKIKRLGTPALGSPTGYILRSLLQVWVISCFTCLPANISRNRFVGFHIGQGGEKLQDIRKGG